MADVVYLHVGAPKTGTTYLQDRLHANRAGLAEHGVHYPVGLHADMFGAALDLIDRPWAGYRDKVHGEWDALVGRVRRSSGTALVSHEILASATTEQIDRVMRDLAGIELHVVYSARDIGRQVPAEWQESLKHRNKRRFRRYLRRLQEDDPRESTMWFWRVHHLPGVLNRWTAGISPERVHLVTVPPPGGPRDELWLRYCRAFGLDPAFAPVDSARTNVSLGIDEAAMLRALNRRLARTDLDAASYAALVRGRIVEEALAQRDDVRRVVLPAHARSWAQEIAEEWVDWVRGSGIDVVGDVDDLLPRFPDGEAWENPERRDWSRVADATMDALVAVLVEAARRPDPELTTTARLTRAARRLRGE
ncbi:MAG TPA: hypothetical protein VFG72_00420 [Marmoricola sp.]|nr:hypothetical protein [Marmoricola sp.]